LQLQVLRPAAPDEVIVRLYDEDRVPLLEGQDIEQIFGDGMRGFDDIGERLLQVQSPVSFSNRGQISQ
jgi:hypothetical protein